MNFHERLAEINKMTCNASEKFKLRVKAMYDAQETGSSNSSNSGEPEKISCIKAVFDEIDKMECSAQEKGRRKAALMFSIMPKRYQPKK